MSASGLTMADVLDRSMSWILQNVHTALPGIIEKYDAVTAKADVSPALRKRWTSDGITTQVDMPVITNVPVIWPRTSKGAITFPLEKGDGVLLIFSERSIDNWLSKGGKSDQTDSRMFDLSDAIAIPGLFALSESIENANSTDLQIKFGSGVILVKSGGQVDVNNGNLTVDA